MAEVLSTEGQRKRRPGVAKAERLSTRVDLTPMVDLGFLLITFFIFTTSLTQPSAMKVIVPDDKGEATPTKRSGALTLLPSAGGTVYYYEGDLQLNNLRTTTIRGIRNVIVDKKRRTNHKDLCVIIKPAQSSVYGEVVDLLNEMTINDVKSYALVDISDEEQGLMR